MKILKGKMQSAGWVLIACFILLIGMTITVHAAGNDWAVHMKVSVPDSRTADGTVWNHLIAGIHEGATDGFDSAEDTFSLIEADDPVQAMFTHGTVPEDKDNDGLIDEWVCNNPDDGFTANNCSLWRDIRSVDTEKVWKFLVLVPANGVTVTFRWTFENSPENIEISLVDLSNPLNTIDMKSTSMYSYTSNFESGNKYGVRYFEIRSKVKGFLITPPDLPDATVGTFYSERLSAVGGIPAWSLEDGEVPPGMFLDVYTGEVSGTPVATGSYTFTVRGDDPVSGYTGSQEYTLNINSIPEVDVSDLPEGIAGTAYTGRITVTEGSSPVTWSIKGNLPEGTTLYSSTGTISGTPIVPGIYDFTVTIKDANGATDSKEFRITVIEPEDKYPPGAIGDLRGTYITDTSILLMWNAPSDDSLIRTAALYDLRYLENCPGGVTMNDSTWSSAVEVSGEPRPQTGALQTYTLTGLKPGMEYCIGIRSMDASGHVSPISNIVMTPLLSGGETSGSSLLTSSIALRRGYNLISLPLIPVPNSRDPLFGPTLGNPVALYRWYSAYPGITPSQYYLEDIVQPGMGYFLYSPADNISIAIEGLRLSDPEYRISLQHGWNMIGTPYTEPVLLGNIMIKRVITGEKRSYIDSVKAGWIGNTIYQLKSGNYDFASFNDDPPAVLEPWIGYWIYVSSDDGVEIIFRRPD